MLKGQLVNSVQEVIVGFGQFRVGSLFVTELDMQLLYLVFKVLLIFVLFFHQGNLGDVELVLLGQSAYFGLKGVQLFEFALQHEIESLDFPADERGVVLVFMVAGL